MDDLRKDTALIREGFWWSKYDPHYPTVTEGVPFPGQAVVVEQLRALQDRLKARHALAIQEYEVAIEKWRATTSVTDRIHGIGEPQYPEGTDAAPIISYRGSSRCRVCGITNGYTEYFAGGFRWPSGYLHYIEVHHVEPSAGFRAMLEASASGEPHA